MESREGEEGRDRAIYGFKDLHTSRIGDREENGDREEECRQRRSFLMGFLLCLHSSFLMSFLMPGPTT
jgi:hypothetical protein